LDEVEKIANNMDICSALLHITDPMQNNAFKDTYLSGVSTDLSHIWFIYSMNSYPKDSALRDRMYTVEIPGYEVEDKIQIIKNYLIPRSLKNTNIPKNSIRVSDKVTKYLIQKTTSPEDKGVRMIENVINEMISKIDFIVKHQDKKGTLKGFDMSFGLGKFVKYPLTITNNIVDTLL
jgi:ATP-dependent Lon protease